MHKILLSGVRSRLIDGVPIQTDSECWRAEARSVVNAWQLYVRGLPCGQHNVSLSFLTVGVGFRSVNWHG